MWKEYKGLLRILYETKTYRLLVIILIQLTGSLLLVPVLPSLLTDDFATARQNNGTAVHCGEYEPSDAPEVCVKAHGDVVTWSTTSGFFQNAVFSILVSPTLGSWSDIHGRKKVIILSQLLSIAPIVVLILHVSGLTRLCWIYVVQAFTQSVSIIAPSLAYMSDRIDREHRAAAFGLIIASFSVAILVGPPLGSTLSLDVVPYVTLLMLATATMGTVLFLPESLGSGANASIEEKHPGDTARAAISASEGFVNALKILTRSPLFVRLTTILVITAATGEALQDLLIQYLQLRLGFGPADTSKMFMVLGAGALLVQGFLLQLLLRAVGETRLLFFGLVVGALQQLLLVLATSKWQAIGAVALGSLGSVTFPTISGIKANNSSAQEQGAVQGALYGARALSSGVGPLIFGVLFRLFLDSSPGTPFVLGALLMAVAAAIAWGLNEEQDCGLHSLETDDWRHGVEAESMSLLPHST